MAEAYIVDAVRTPVGRRTCALVAGLPESVPGVTIDRQCGSSQQAVHFAAQAVMSGTADLIVAGAYVDTRIQTIYGGTTEIMKEVIGRDLAS
jgi:acetyl-CoA acetyltransferase